MPKGKMEFSETSKCLKILEKDLDRFLERKSEYEVQNYRNLTNYNLNQTNF
ncbi:hypothetical protein SAMN03097699_2002 [Flavobacteriaceae bacterium MAR_2010_188]|nr:hypothetical protein SAMN03097699_2002 [Flavobacteriaceae bacterium MAR_2010_188]